MLRLAALSMAALVRVSGFVPGIGVPALAAETDPGFALTAARAPCKALVKLRADFDAKTHLMQLSPGQFHFVEGVYVGSPSTPEGLPPGDGAMPAQHDGDKDGVIVRTRGPLACAPLPIPEKLIKLMGAIKTGALDDDGDEL
jgi:hypothetical protein